MCSYWSESVILVIRVSTCFRLAMGRGCTDDTCIHTSTQNRERKIYFWIVTWYMINLTYIKVVILSRKIHRLDSLKEFGPYSVLTWLDKLFIIDRKKCVILESAFTVDKMNLLSWSQNLIRLIWGLAGTQSNNRRCVVRGHNRDNLKAAYLIAENDS